MLFVLVLFLLRASSAFYLPGVSPRTFKMGDKVPILVNHITPSDLYGVTSKNQHNEMNNRLYVYSFDYYFPKLHFCRPDTLEPQASSLGSVLLGDRVYNSPFDVSMLEEKECELMCTSTYSKTDSLFVNRLIRAGYHHNWLVDGLPAARALEKSDKAETYYGTGFPIGLVKGSVGYLVNHFDITIEYHEAQPGEYRIVGVSVAPYSVKDVRASCKKLQSAESVLLNNLRETEATFSYSVKFKESKTRWATRWDKYLHVYNAHVHWNYLFCVTLGVVGLSCLLVKTLHGALSRDLTSYNTFDFDADVKQDRGWNLLHGDVFRTPKKPMILSVFVGNGVQLFFMSFTTMFFALMGLVSPENRGFLFTLMFVLYAVFSSVGAFVSGLIYKHYFGGRDTKRNTILSALLIPGIFYAVFTILNFLLIIAQSSGAVPLGAMIQIILLWLVLSVPFSVAGSFLAFKSETSATVQRKLEIPVKTNPIPRQIPAQPFYTSSSFSVLATGLYPFVAIATELSFIMDSVWFNRLYYMFGFLFICFVLMTLSCGIVTVLMTYVALNNEDYRWHWRSFVGSGACAVYAFVYSVLWAKLPQSNGIISVLLYLGYTSLSSFLLFLMCGSVGFLCSLVFVSKIYSNVKID